MNMGVRLGYLTALENTDNLTYKSNLSSSSKIRFGFFCVVFIHCKRRNLSSKWLQTGYSQWLPFKIIWCTAATCGQCIQANCSDSFWAYVYS